VDSALQINCDGGKKINGLTVSANGQAILLLLLITGHCPLTTAYWLLAKLSLQALNENFAA